MEELFKVINLEYEDRVGILTTNAHSQVKSTKKFPIYMRNGKCMIFKPLSKTKPYTTPLFAFSEVFWSYIINKYFDSATPRSYLAIAKGIEREQPKCFEHGILVESITPNGERLINLYDYFIKYPDPLVDIKDYVNYCMINYDYSNILLSDFIRNNKEVGEGLVYQILLSVLRQDQNFHYENITFYDENLSLAPPIDFEFSTQFLFPDKPAVCQYYQKKYCSELAIKYEKNDMSSVYRQLMLNIGLEPSTILTKNICIIIRLYPDVVLEFIRKLDALINDLPKIVISDDDNYIKELNSDYWEVWHAYYKDNDLEKYKKLKEKIKLKSIDKDSVFRKISSDILEFSKWFNLILKTYLIGYYNGIEELENLTIKQLLAELNITDDNVIIADIDIDTKKLILKPLIKTLD